MRIIDKTGPLHNPADRDHCLQYMMAVALLHGKLTGRSLRGRRRRRPAHRPPARRDASCARSRGTRPDYLDPAKRSIAQRRAGRVRRRHEPRERVEVEYPLGHRRRRAEALPLLRVKLNENLAAAYGEGRAAELVELLLDERDLPALPADDLLSALAAVDARTRA